MLATWSSSSRPLQVQGSECKQCQLTTDSRQAAVQAMTQSTIDRHNASTPGMVAQRRVWQLAEQRTTGHELCHHKHQAMRPAHANQLQAGAEPKHMSWLGTHVMAVGTVTEQQNPK